VTPFSGHGVFYALMNVLFPTKVGTARSTHSS